MPLLLFPRSLLLNVLFRTLPLLPPHPITPPNQNETNNINRTSVASGSAQFDEILQSPEPEEPPPPIELTGPQYVKTLAGASAPFPYFDPLGISSKVGGFGDDFRDDVLFRFHFLETLLAWVCGKGLISKKKQTGLGLRASWGGRDVRSTEGAMGLTMIMGNQRVGRLDLVPFTSLSSS